MDNLNFYKEHNVYDIAIIGAGPAGLTATIYALRDNKNVILFEKEVEGGQVLTTPRLDNVPGFYGVSGQEFVNNMMEQIDGILNDGYGKLNIEYEKVINVDYTNFQTKEGDLIYSVKTDIGEEFFAKKIIFATGSKHRTLGVTGEEDLIGNGICFCVTCDGPFYKNKDVAVIGGGNSAVTEAIELSKYANKVFLIQNLPYLTAEESLIAEIKSIKNIHILTDKTILQFYKEPSDTKITIMMDKHSKYSTYPDYVVVDGVFEAIGFVPDNSVARNVADIDEYGYIANIVGARGVFAAGDCRQKDCRQIVTSCADGAKAAIRACQQLNKGVK